MENDSPKNDVIQGRASHRDETTMGKSLIPMRALYERIDAVRRSLPDLPVKLREISQELPASTTRRTLEKLARAIEQDTPTPQIVSQFPEHCWLLTVQSSAATTEALTAMLEQSAYQHSLQTKKLRTIAYPLVLLSVSLTILLAACIFLIPPFDEMYEEFAIRLPIHTQFIINLSRFVTHHPIQTTLIVLIGIGTTAFALWLWIGDGPLKRSLVGPAGNQSSVRQSLARVALQIAELTDEGVPLSETLKICAESNPSPTMRSVFGDLAMQATNKSHDFRKSRAAIFLPPNFLFALNPTPFAESAFQSGSFNEAAVASPNTTMLRELATNYRDLSIHRRDGASYILGQITIVGVGLMIAFTVISLFAPMVSLITSLS